MLLEKGKVSGFQLKALVIGFVFGSSVITPPGIVAGHDAWIAVFLGLMEGLLIAWIFTALTRQFQNKTIVEINSLVYGKILGTCMSALFIWYLFHLGSLVLDHYVRFFNLEVYPATPKTIILVLLMLVCASTVGRGIEVIARCSLILTAFILLIVVSDTLLLIPHIDLNNLLPVLDVPASQLLWAGHGAASFPFGETAAFLMVLAFLNKSESGSSAIFGGLLTAGFVLIVITARNAAVLGGLATISNYPSYLAAQVIDAGEIFTRVEVVVAINLITMGFLKISVLLYGTVLGLAQVFNFHSYRPLILPVGILMVIVALTEHTNTFEMIEFINKSYPVYAVPFQIGIPLITLVVAKLRKLPQTGGNQL
ncbi:MAG TPA: endospore germination permease [Syntrophomonadaceae bacterium]|nr:endospore germination permease [Syntrophomonadaceae bacterium]HNX28781.1 endospore germination permease [Syntrophomonadaceae bacterium]HPR92877.1 endospore germination permease [Syntrophomonadaceae bacterium]